MARQSMHNRRAGRGATGGGASWISYSDMMAALLLLFVLILCYSLVQYFHMLDEKTLELNLEKEKVAEREQQVIIIQGNLDKLQLKLDDKEEELNQKKGELDQANAILLSREQEVAALQLILIGKQEELDEATSRLASQQEALAAQAKRIDALVGIRSNIIQDLSDSLARANLKATVGENGSIVLDSKVFFEYEKSDIRAEGKALLDRFIPVYLNVLLNDKYADYLGEIIIEGHTDSSGSYNNNLKLSQQRALQVALYCLDMPSLTSSQRHKLEQILTATGRSESDLVYVNGVEDPEASRRVEFKFSLRDADMIEEMKQILQVNDLSDLGDMNP